MSMKIKTAFAVLFLVSGQGLCRESTLSPDDLTVRAALPQQTVCSGAKSLTLELYVTNNSSRNVSISREWTREAVDYAVAYDVKEGFARHELFSVRSDPISGVRPERASVKLPVGSARRFETTLALDQDFFKKPAFYKARVHYWGTIAQPNGTPQEVQLPSNWFLFEVKACPVKASSSSASGGSF